MTQPEYDYRVDSQVPAVREDPRDKVTKPGYDITFYDPVTQGTYTVFLPKQNDSPENADLLIRDELERRRAIHNLGRD